MTRHKPTNPIKIFLVAFLSLTFFAALVVPSSATPTCTLRPARSLVVSGNVFLGGDFIELGLSPKGSWGTNANAPADSSASDFRGRQSSRQIGLVSDVDGFCATAGDNVDKPIDYFMPGAEEERWGVGFKIAGASHYGSFSQIRGDQSSTGVTATHTVTDETSGDNLAAKVVSIVSLSGTQVLRVTATHSFAKSQAFFKTQVVIENLYGSALTDVRYHRSFDPDNAKDQEGDYDTRNTIVSSISSGGANVVEAKLTDANMTALNTAGKILGALADGTPSITTSLPIIFYSKDSQSAVYWGGFLNANPFLPYLSTDPFTSPQAVNTTGEVDQAIGIVLRQNNLAAGASSRTMSYITSLDRRDFSALSAELSAEAGEPEPEPSPATAPSQPSIPAPRIPTFDAFAAGPMTVTPGQDLVLTGSRLNCTTFVEINSQPTSFSYGTLPSGLSQLTIGMPSNLKPGPHSMRMDSCGGPITFENLLVVPKPPAVFEAVARNSIERMLIVVQVQSFSIMNRLDYNHVECIVNASAKHLQTAARHLLGDVCKMATTFVSASKGSTSELRNTHKPENVWVRVTLSKK